MLLSGSMDQFTNTQKIGHSQVARSALLALAVQLDSLATEVRNIERQLMAWHRRNAASQRLETIPGVGLITATALAASVPDPAVFKSGRQFAAYLDLVPRQNSSGGKDRLGHISKMGNGYLRRLLVVGATSVTRRAPTTDTRPGVTRRAPTRLGPITSRAQANPARHRRHCQQDRAYSLGVAGEGRKLQSRTSNLNEGEKSGA